MQPPLSVIIPALDAAKTLDRALSPLTSVIASLLVHEVIVSDGGSTDETPKPKLLLSPKPAK